MENLPPYYEYLLSYSGEADKENALNTNVTATECYPLKLSFESMQ